MTLQERHTTATDGFFSPSRNVSPVPGFGIFGPLLQPVSLSPQQHAGGQAEHVPRGGREMDRQPHPQRQAGRKDRLQAGETSRLPPPAEACVFLSLIEASPAAPLQIGGGSEHLYMFALHDLINGHYLCPDFLIEGYAARAL